MLDYTLLHLQRCPNSGKLCYAVLLSVGGSSVNGKGVYIEGGFWG